VQQRENLLRQIPHVDKLMKNDIITSCEVYRHELTDAVRDVLTELREGLISGEADTVPRDDEIAKTAVELAVKRSFKGIRRVINGTGVILHSNLGRACLSKTAAEAAAEAAASYSTLEYDVEKGERGSRTACAEEYLNKLTGCEASLIVNNNAAAVLLILTSIASGGNVLVSRGELVEIGGGFRVPEIISQCGCTLRSVGTTNKTRINDYKKAINEDTKALLKVHTSNFKIVGFSQSVTIKELAALGKPQGIPVIEDIGSGALIDMQRYGIYDEPMATESLRNGADIVSFSGDKLLGGPQCGIVTGSKKYIDIMKNHPLYRALRADKMTIAALEATLRIYADPSAAELEIPVLTMLSMSGEVLRSRAEKLCDEIRKHGGDAEIIEAKSVAGGGAVPGLELKSYAVSPFCKKSAEEFQKQLRNQPIPIIGHIEDNRLLLDVRTIYEYDYEYIAEAVKNG
jgi:L-seryl-tRNA(Ser) seleniumtransferase